ncbi:MAG: hypothetical protein CMJ58_23355 [Planctomycetaceae bacterium]|nr:hypothetical protein [Planctomycetaceae bacterium]
MSAVGRYLGELNAAVGAGWNRFWYEPAPATTLGVVRIAAAALALVAVAAYGPDLIAWFGAGGMLPVPLVRELYPDHLSLLDYVSGSGLWVLYAATLAALAALLLGVGGRVAAIAALVLTLSFFHRAPLVTAEFEPVVAFLLAYLCIGRVSDAFSPASRFGGPSKSPPSPAVSNRIAQRLIQIHVTVVHAMMAVAMFAAADGVWFSGEGIWLAAARPEGPLVDLTGWENSTKLFALASHLTTAYFVAFPLAAWSGRLRPLALAGAAIVWPLLAVVTGKVLFCLAMAAGAAAFIPAEWLARAAEPTAAAD